MKWIASLLNEPIAEDHAVRIGHPRQAHHPEFIALRRTLLASLGVETGTTRRDRP